MPSDVTLLTHMHAESLIDGIHYLINNQHADGCWTDFWLPVGTSDAWVTAYIGLALHHAYCNSALDASTRTQALDSARRAATWLLTQLTPNRPAWGYNEHTPADADTTAHVLSLLARLDFPVPDNAIDFLEQHKRPEEGYSTYRWSENWSLPADDITAAALRALSDVRRLDTATLRAEWCHLLSPKQAANGWWHGYWWMTPNYTTGLTLEVWQLAGKPALALPVQPSLPTDNVFNLAWSIRVQHCLSMDATEQVTALLFLQYDDGGWESASILRVPSDTATDYTHIARDSRRLFTTATAISALSAFKPHSIDTMKIPSPHPNRSVVGRYLDRLVQNMAEKIDFLPAGVQQAVDLFTLLTADSFAEPTPWPAEQLSSLSGGVPIEFSANVGPHVRPALRYAVEVGNPYLEPYRRAQSAVNAVARVAEQLGYQTAWEHIVPAIDCLVRPELSGPDARRFWVWGGVDQSAPINDDPNPVPALKIYLNLLHAVDGGSAGHTARERIELALSAIELPLSAELRAVLDTLDTVGFLHEAGFGFIGKRFACKLYYELHGWRRDFVRNVLDMAGLQNARINDLCSAIPGILQESLASKRRAGIALRIHPMTGQITEVTSAMAFPMPLIAPIETTRRVQAWIDTNDWQPDVYQATVATLLPTWERESFGRLHSLFTRTVSAKDNWASIYLRPQLG